MCTGKPIWGYWQSPPPPSIPISRGLTRFIPTYPRLLSLQTIGLSHSSPFDPHLAQISGCHPTYVFVPQSWLETPPDLNRHFFVFKDLSCNSAWAVAGLTK